jgi:hypothetical protein
MENYKYYCEKCNFKNNNRILYEKHLETTLHKTGEKKKKGKKEDYKCDKCDYTTEKISNYNSHFLNNHSTKEERREKYKYYCEYCDMGVFTESMFKKHLETLIHKRKAL